MKTTSALIIRQELQKSGFLLCSILEEWRAELPRDDVKLLKAAIANTAELEHRYRCAWQFAKERGMQYVDLEVSVTPNPVLHPSGAATAPPDGPGATISCRGVPEHGPNAGQS